MKTMFSYIKPYKWFAVIAISLMLVELAVELMQPLIIKKIIDDGIVLQDSATVWLWGSIMMLIAFLGFIAGITNSFFQHMHHKALPLICEMHCLKSTIIYNDDVFEVSNGWTYYALNK